ncbi:MAG: T6SS protein serine/threonine phosphatase PppA [Rhodanobacteraceae bacterium]|jgi:protein phosphatase|nr:MAG: T6SS protein serine/threonine phosphatase PppA [Rhodanobacteraceae bacterium]
MTRQFQSAGRSEVGKVRRRNEDAILVRDEAGLWAVADGLGGHAAGDYASALIVARLAAVPRPDGVFDFIESIEDTLVDVNADLRRAAQARAVDLIASTVVLLVHDRDLMLCGWVGDSRGYCHDGARLMQMTRDHLYGAENDVDRWSGGPAQAQPAGGVLTRAVGADASLFVDWVAAGSRPGVQFVLCSDGINKEMSDAEIEAACARHASPGGVLDAVFETSLARAARDNLSAVIVRLQDGAGSRMPAAAERLREANRSLHALDDAHRLGEISRDDYRARRRRLLETLTGGDDDGPTRRPGKSKPVWKRWLSRRR